METSDEPVDFSRRRVLELLGASASAAIAGCGRRRDSRSTTSVPSPTPTRTSTGTSTDSPTETRTETADEVWEVDPVEHDKLIGTAYYLWYSDSRHWQNGYRGTPLLGEYDSRDEGVINQHVQWARDHGITTFLIRWGGPRGWDDVTLRDHFLEADLADEITFCLQPSLGLFENDPKIDLDDAGNRRQLEDIFRYLDSHYFDRTNHLEIDGKPVLYLYLAHAFVGDVRRAFERARASIDTDVYVIGDLNMSFGDSMLRPELMAQFDAVTEYSGMYRAVEGIDENFVDTAMDNYLDWYLIATENDVDFIPTVLPAFDKTDWYKAPNDMPVLERRPDRFRRYAAEVLDYLEPGLDAVFVTSFNEWHEYTTVEPAEEYANSYLEIVAEELARADPEYVDTETYVRMRIDFNKTVSPGSRPIAFMLGELSLRDGSGPVAEYDIGVAGSEPSFVEGVYPPERNEGNRIETWRWLGGPTEQAVLYFPPNATEATEADLFGKPQGRHRDITGTVYVQGTRTDFVRFDRGTGSYTVSLR